MLEYPIRYVLWVTEILAGIIWVYTTDVQCDLKPFLGPDWKPEWQGATTLIAN